MNIVFMGTPDFAVPALDSIVNEGNNIMSVVTQPDKPRGRGKKLSFSPVKEKALFYNIPVMQPIRIKSDPDFIESLRKMKPDVIVVVAFGQILPEELLSIPIYGCINVHASLLPKLRGSAPINWAIINGENETGITTMLMDKGVDTGDMLLRKTTVINQDETAGELQDRLKKIGAGVLLETLSKIKDGSLKTIPQDNSQYSYAKMLNKETGKIIWDRNSIDIKNLVRGVNPWPVAFSYLNDEKIKIWKVEIENIMLNSSHISGQVWNTDRQGIHVYTGNGGIIIKEVQSENGKRVDAYSYVLGHPISKNSLFQ